MNRYNPIPDQRALFADRVRQVARGVRTACACDGPPGVGKTHTLNEVAAEEHKVLRLVSTTAGGLVQVAYQYRDIPILAFDDFDKALRQEATANIVKQLIAPEKVRKITHQTVKAMDNANRGPRAQPHIAPPVFNVRCGLVMLTNVDMANPKAIHKDMRDHVRALEDRGLEFVHISRDPQHIADYVAQLAHTPGMLARWRIDLDGRALSEVTDFFLSNIKNLPTLSVRRFQSIARDRETMPNRWKELQYATFANSAAFFQGTPDTRPQ